MEYNKQLFKKTNDKKILHKVRKHWVTVSIALLGMIGATGVAKSNVHASNLNTNHQTNNSINANNTSSIRTRLVNDSSNNMPKTSVTHNGRSLNIKSAGPARVTSIHQFNRDQMMKQTDELRDRIVKDQTQFTPKTLHTSQPSSVTAKQSGQAAPQATSISSGFSNLKSVSSSASQTGMTMTSIPEPEVGDDDTDTINSALSDIQSKYGQVGTLTNQAKTYIAQARSASNIANAQLNRYSNINPHSVNSSSSDPNYGSTADFDFSDNSEVASNYDNRLNIDLNNMPSAGAIQDSVKASFANDVANSLSTLISVNNDKGYENSLVNLANEVDMYYDQAQELIGSMSSMATDANNQALSISNAFSSVSAAADSAGSALYNSGSATNNTSDTFTTYQVANVSNATELHNAFEDPDVHQINIDKDISMWSVQVPAWADNYLDVPPRNLNINGLKDDGTWHTVDFADFNYELYNGGANAPGFPMMNVALENMNIYGADYWGPVSVNNDASLQAIMKYKNLNYVGAQLAYNEANTRGIFEGHINVDAGAAYSPTGLYTKCAYKVPGNLSLYPGIIKDDIDTNDGSHINPSQDVYTGKTLMDSKTGTPKMIHGTRIGGYLGFTTLNGEPAFADGQTPDLAIPWSFNYAFHNDTTDTPPMQNTIKDGIDTPSDQQILQINDNLSAVFKSGCVFNGSTTSGDGIAINSGGYVYLEPGAKVNLAPRGYSSESTASGNDNTLPSGIDINGTGDVHVGPGSTLNITPMTDTDRFMPSDTRLAAQGGSVTNCENYAPAAINVKSGGTIDVYSGGTLNIKYPDQYNYSLPDGSLNNGYEPKGAIYMGGTSAIHVQPYSNLIINGGGPSDTSHNQGNLVYFESGGSDANSYVDAQSHSNVQLSCGGNQQIMLFYAPTGTPITVNDPKQFSLDLTHNTNPASQLANDGVSIEGDQVTGYDQPNQNKNDPDYDKFDHSFGQYNELVLPGKRYEIPKYLLDDIKQIIGKIKPIIMKHNANGGSVHGDTIWSDLNTAINGSGGIIPTFENDPNGTNKLGFNHYDPTNANPYSHSSYDILNLIDQAHLIPFGISYLHNSDNESRVDNFNNTIDLPYIITYSMVNWIEGNTSPVYNDKNNPNYQKEPAGSPNLNMGLDPDKEGKIVSSEINGYDPNDINMYYDNLSIPIHKNGFNLTRGFAFKGVPHSYVEGVKVNNGIISGYAQPGSYIKIREANDKYDSNESTGQIDANTTPIVSADDTINDHNYDYDDDKADQNTNGYVTTAKSLKDEPEIGFWSYKLPDKLPDGTTALDQNKLVVTAHTATVGNKNSARVTDYYVTGRGITRGNVGISTVPADQDTPQPADTHNVAPNGADYAAYLSSDNKTLTVTGNFDNYGSNGIDGNNNNLLSNVENLNLGNAWNINSANNMFKNMGQLYTINQIGDWNTNSMHTAVGTFDKDDRMDAQYLGPIVSTWGNSSLTDNNMGNGNDDPQYNDLISTVDTSKGQTTDPIDFIYDGNQVGSNSITGYSDATYNIDANKLPDGYTLNNEASVTLNGYPHYINVVKKNSPIYTGDTVPGAEAYYQNPDYFPEAPQRTYPSATDEDPTGNLDDPTDTDDDDAGNVQQTGTDNNGNPVYKVSIYTGNERQSYKTDDTDAGRYFEAGRLKGDLDKENMVTDNSIYVMPEPFIIGYLTAQFNKLNRQDIDDDIENDLNIVKKDYKHVFQDYLPQIIKDGNNADKDLMAISKTTNTLYSLINYSDQYSANPFSYYPYSNLQSLANTISPEAMAASGYEYSEYSNNGGISSGSNNNDQAMYSDVYNIDNLLNEAIHTLIGYEVDVNNDANIYDTYYDSASNAAKNKDSADKEINLLEASAIYSEAGTYDGSADSVTSSANSEDSSASNDNNSASYDSSEVHNSVSDVRTPTSNAEASDFDSVAQSYAASASYDTGVIRRDLREVRHRYHQLDSAGLHSDHVFASDSAEINKLSSEVNSEIEHDNLSSGNSLNDATSASSALNSANSALNMASTKYSSAMSAFASSGYTSEISAINDINLLRFGSSSDSDGLNSEESQVNIEDSVQSADVKAGDFDGASDVNIGFNSSDDTYNTSSNITDPNVPSTYNDGETKDSALTYQYRGVFYSLLDKARDTKARNDMINAALAQAKVRSLAYSAGGVGAVEQAVPMLVHSIMLGASPDASHGVVPNRNGNDANHAGKAQNNNSVQTSNIKVISVKKDANGNVIDSESQDFPVDRPVGSNYVVDPQDYAPAGYHAVNDQIVNDPMTSNGLDKKQIVFNYQTNDSNSNDTSHTSQGVVNINYVNSTNNEVVHTEPIHGNLGKPFNLSQYDGHLPSGYRFNSVTDGMNINTFMNQPQNVTVKVTPIGSQQSSASHNVPNTPARPQSSSANNSYVPSQPQSSSNNVSNSESASQNSAVDEAQSAASDGQVNFWDNSNSADNNLLIPQSNSADNSASDSTNGNSAVKSSASSSNPSSQKSANAGSMNNDSTDGNNSANNDDPDENDNTNNDSSDSHVNRTGNGSKSSIGNNDGSSVTRPSHSYVNGVKDALSSDPAKRDSSGYMKGYMDQKRYNDSDSQNLPQTGEVDYAKLAVALLLIASATGLDGLIDRRHSRE